MKKYINLLFVPVLFLLISKANGQKQDEKIEFNYTIQDTIKISNLLNLGSSMYYQNLDSAKYYWQKAIDIAEHLVTISKNEKNIENTIASQKYLSSGLCNMGLLESALGNNQLALALTEKALVATREIEYKQGIATCLNNIGLIYYNLGDYKKSLDYYEQSLSISEEIDYNYLEAFLLSNIGSIYYYFGEIDKSIANFEKSIIVRKELNDERGLAQSLVSLGLVYSFKGNNAKAIENLTGSLSIAEKIGDNTLLAESLNNLGFIYYNQGLLKNALDVFSKSLELRINSKDKKGVSNSYNNIGAVYEAQGELYRAIEFYKKALDIQSEIGDKQGMSTSLNNIGKIYNSLGEIPSTIEYYTKSLALKEELGDKSGMAISLMNIGYEKYIYGDPEKAFDYFNRAKKIQEEIGDTRALIKNYNNIGKFLSDKGDSTRAMDYYIKGLNISQSLGEKMSIANSLLGIGTIYFKKKDFNEALNHYNKSIEIQLETGYKDLQPNTYISIAICELLIGNKTEYENNVQKAYEVSKELNTPDEIVLTASHMRDIALKKNHLEKADSLANEILKITNNSIAINFGILSEKEQELYFSRISPRIDDFNSYAYFRKDKNPQIIGTVYDNALKTKGILLKSSTATRNAILNSKDSALISSYYQWLHVKKQLVKLNAEGKTDKNLEEISSAMENEIVKKSQLFNNFRKEFGIVWKDIRSSLKKNEAAIEFINFNISKNRNLSNSDSIYYFALILQPQSIYPEMIKLCSEKELSSALGVISENNLKYINSLYGRNNKSNTLLYNLIWKPFDSLLNNTKQIFISPSGLLHKVSFPAIAKKDNIYLCDLYNLELLSSTMRIAFPEQFYLNNKMTASLFGGINYNSDNTKEEIWKYLEGTKKEADLIENILKENNIQTFYSSANSSTEENFKKIASKSNIIHIATHGFYFPNPKLQREELYSKTEFGTVTFRGGGSRGFGVWSFLKNENPLMRSGIVLAKANDVWNIEQRPEGEEDGVLTAQEVASIDMQNTYLIVLSACETGLGDIKGSEGVYGLQRAFKMAGAKHLIMSLWQVPDQETTEFMNTFYSKLIKSKNLKTSFFETQKQMRKKYDPYFWAAFVLLE